MAEKQIILMFYYYNNIAYFIYLYLKNVFF